METQTITLEEMDALIGDYRSLREKYEVIKKLSSEAHAVFKEAEGKVVRSLESAGKKKYHLDGVGTFLLVTKETVKTPKTIEDKRELFEYIKDKYGDDVLDGYLSIHSQTLNSFYKQELKEASDPALFSLPGLEDSTVTQTVSFRKA